MAIFYSAVTIQITMPVANPTNKLPTIRSNSATGTVMRTTTPLDLGQGLFDSAETEILSMAFEKAWAFVEFDPMLGVLEASEKQSQLARCLMALLKQGETDPTPLANSAIKMLRRNRQSGVRKQRARTSSAKAPEVSYVVPISRSRPLTKSNSLLLNLLSFVGLGDNCFELFGLGCPPSSAPASIAIATAQLSATEHR